MSALRAAAVCLGFLALAGAVVVHVALRSSATLGPPSLAEAEANVMSRGFAVRLDLARDARRAKDGTLRFPVAGTGDQGPDRAPRLLVFLDGKLVRFERRSSALPRDVAAGAYYFPIDRRRVEVAVRCPPSEACQRVSVIPDGRAFRVELALKRLARHPEWAVFALASVVGCALAALLTVLQPPSLEIAASALVGTFFLAAWWVGSGGASAGGDTLLALAAMGFCAPLTRRVVSDAHRGWGRRGLNGLEKAAAAAGRPFAAARGQSWAVGLGVAAAFLLFLPLTLRGHTFFIDWANHLYYAARQADGLGELHHPTYFLHSTRSGPFYPYFAFYGGTLYVLTALVGRCLGSVGAGYVALLGLGFTMALGGTTWLAIQAGLERRFAVLAGLVVVSSAYYLTNAYGRGSWAELIATSSVALLAASFSSAVWGPQVRRRDASLLFLAGTIFCGSHTITLVWGSVFLLLLFVATWPARRVAGLALPPQRLGLAAALLALALGVNAWFLAPALAYGRATYIGGYAARGFASDTQFLNVPAVLFHPGRVVPSQSSTPGLYTQVSVYVFAWALLAALFLFRREQPRPVRFAWPALALLLGLFFWLIFASRLDLPWIVLPRVLKILQFQFRLHTYVTYVLAGLVVVALLAARRASRPALWPAALVAALAIQVGLGIYQAWTARTYFPIADIVRAGADSPPTLDEARDYRFVDHPDVRPLGEPVFSTTMPALPVDVHQVSGDRLDVVLPGPDPVQTEIVYSPLIEGTGDVTVAGRTAEGFAVLRARRQGPGAHAGAVVASRPWPVVVGRTISIFSLIAAVALLTRLRRAPRSGA